MWKTLEGLFGDWQDRPALEDATYEELFSDSFSQALSCPEIGRRLAPIVHAMALAETQDAAEASRLTAEIFKEFVHQFPTKAGETGLRRLAQIVRGVIGKEAFYASSLPLLYYVHLPLYHLSEKSHRLYLKAMLDRGLAHSTGRVDLIDELASEFRVSREELRQAIQQGWQELDRIMRSEFDESELREYTEGFLPWSVGRVEGRHAL